MTRDRLNFWLWAGAALIAGLLLRLWFVLHMARIAGDSLIYGAIAKNWLLHGVYGFAENRLASGAIEISPTLIRLPGYPFFIATCFRLFGVEHYNAVLFTQIAVDLCTCCLVAALAGRLFGRRALLPVLWIAALCPFIANYVAAPLTETLVLATIALALYAFVRWLDVAPGFNRWLWILAAALSASLLLRPDQALLAAAILPAMLWRSLATRERRLRPLHSALPALAAALCILLPLVPWTARNWQTFEVFQPLAPRYANDPGEIPPLGFNRWYRTWAIDFISTEQVYWNCNGDRVEVDDLPTRAFAAASPEATDDLESRTSDLLNDYNETTTDSPEIDARFNALATERIHAHPLLYYVALPTARLLDMAFRPRTEMISDTDDWWNWSDHPAQSALAASYAALNLACFALAFAGYFAWRRRTKSLSSHPIATSSLSSNLVPRELVFSMAAYILLRAALLLTLDNSEPRYTLEFFPILFVWIGALFASRLVDSDQKLSSRSSDAARTF
jgi:hypothetical protein